MDNINRAFDDKEPAIPYSERLDRAFGERDFYAAVYARVCFQRNCCLLVIAVLTLILIYVRWL